MNVNTLKCGGGQGKNSLLRQEVLNADYKNFLI